MKQLFLTALFLTMPVASFAHDFVAGDVAIGHPYAKPTIASAKTGAGYFVLTNQGTEDDQLISVEADFPRVMMHNTTVQDGVATMTHLEEGVVIPAGKSIQFAPSGMHVMFMGLNGDPFEIGDEIPATLTFKRGGKVDIVFVVEETETETDHDH